MKAKIKDIEIIEEKSVIHNGIIQFLTVFRLCGPKNVRRYMKKIEQSALIVSEVEGKNISIKQGFFDDRYEVTTELANSIETSKNEFLQNSGLPQDLLKVSVIEMPNNDVNNQSKIFIMDTLCINVKDYLDAMIKDMNANLSNKAFEFLPRTDMLIQPISVYKDNIETNLFVMLSIFANGLAILKIEYCITNTQIITLSDRSLKLEYDSRELPLCFHDKNYDKFGYFKQDIEGNEEDIRLEIIKVISGIINKEIRVGADYELLLMSNYSSKPDAIGNISQKYNKDIAYLVAAPIREYSEPSRKKLDEIVSQSHYEINKYIHVYVSAARKAIIAKVGDVESKLSTEFEIETIESQELIDRAAFQGVTPAVEVVLLKYFINCDIADKCCDISDKSLKELLKIKMEIHNLTLLEINSFRFKFDTMAKLSEFIDELNTYLLSNEQIEEIVSSFNDVVTTKESINSERSTTLFSWLGIILSLILSFTGVRDIVEFTNKTYQIIDVSDNHSLFYTSFKSWFFLVLMVAIAYVLHRKSRK